jgi:hypothetical protein
LAETSEEWETGKTYLNMDNQTQPSVQNAKEFYRKKLAPPRPSPRNTASLE